MTKDKRTILAMNIAASMFSTFVDLENRGPNWTPDKMPDLITRQVRVQAYIYGITNTKQLEDMTTIAVDFYTSHLKDALK